MARDWTSILTLLGWLMAFVGLDRMAARGAPQLATGAATYAVTAALLTAGLILTFKFYGAGADPP